MEINQSSGFFCEGQRKRMDLHPVWKNVLCLSVLFILREKIPIQFLTSLTILKFHLLVLFFPHKE